jgi:hypothetical protein
VHRSEDLVNVYVTEDKPQLMAVCFAVRKRNAHRFYLLIVGVEVVYFHLITLRHTPQSVGLLWTRDRPVAETST